jgi:hypothetical protein
VLEVVEPPKDLDLNAWSLLTPGWSELLGPQQQAGRHSTCVDLLGT